jgi:2-phospho-L-lactate guanylyltransferase
VDDESDVLELLIHGEGKRRRDYLLSIGYRISCEEKDPKIVRIPLT